MFSGLWPSRCQARLQESFPTHFLCTRTARHTSGLATSASTLSMAASSFSLSRTVPHKQHQSVAAGSSCFVGLTRSVDEHTSFTERLHCACRAPTSQSARSTRADRAQRRTAARPARAGTRRVSATAKGGDGAQPGQPSPLHTGLAAHLLGHAARAAAHEIQRARGRQTLATTSAQSNGDDTQSTGKMDAKQVSQNKQMDECRFLVKSCSMLYAQGRPEVKRTELYLPVGEGEVCRAQRAAREQVRAGTRTLPSVRWQPDFLRWK